MLFGNCTTIADARIFHHAGYDFGEMPIVYALQPEQPEAEVMPSVQAQMAASRLAADAWYLFLPGDMHIIGEGIDNERVARYVHSVCTRVASFNGKVIIFGSAGARQIPPGVSPARARSQLIEFLALAAEAAALHDLTIALEPMCVRVCNHINTIAEAAEVVRAAGHPALGVTADLFHITEDNQPLDDIRLAGPLLAHVHVAGEGRRTPVAADIPRLVDMFRILKEMDYAGRVAVEAVWTDVGAQASETLDTLRRAWDRA